MTKKHFVEIFTVKQISSIGTELIGVIIHSLRHEGYGIDTLGFTFQAIGSKILITADSMEELEGDIRNLYYGKIEVKRVLDTSELRDIKLD